MEQKKENLGIKRTFMTVLITITTLAFPILGWLLLIGLLAHPTSDVGGIPTPNGFVYKRCPNCSHFFRDDEVMLDEYSEWFNYNRALLGVYRKKEWTGV